MVQLRQERRDRIADQIAPSRNHQIDSSAIGQFDEAALIDGHNRRWTRLHQRLQPRLGFQAQAPVAHQFSDEQSASGKRQSLEGQTNE